MVIVNEADNSPAALKVAAVARRTGVSVRTLHYYEEIGLLKPSGRTSSGHRLYTPADIQQLQQIRSLQQIGLSLTDIGDCLAGDVDPRQVVADHLARVKEQRESLQRLEDQLQRVAHQLDRGACDDARTTETLLIALELITMYDKYFTPQQQERLEAHAQKGEEAVTPVIRELEEARQRGLAPRSGEVQRLWQRFEEAVDSVTGGDDQMKAATFKLLHDEQAAREEHGISEELFAYMGSIVGGPKH